MELPQFLLSLIRKTVSYFLYTVAIILSCVSIMFEIYARLCHALAELIDANRTNTVLLTSDEETKAFFEKMYTNPTQH